MKKGKTVLAGKRMELEVKTVEIMIRRYCRDKHNRISGLCTDCRELLVYARHCLSLCPFQENKTTCGKCPVHWYKDGMRYAGLRMFWSNPVLSLRHFFDGLRREPLVRVKGKKEQPGFWQLFSFAGVGPLLDTQN